MVPADTSSGFEELLGSAQRSKTPQQLEWKRSCSHFPTESRSKVSHLIRKLNSNYSLSITIHTDEKLPLPLDHLAPISFTATHHLPRRQSIWTTPAPSHSLPSAPRCLALVCSCVSVLGGLGRGKEVLWGNTNPWNPTFVATSAVAGGLARLFVVWWAHRVARKEKCNFCLTFSLG